MDVTALASVYDSLIAQAEAITDTASLPATTRSDVDWRLCHIALADRIIATAAREQTDGRTATVDNQPSMDPDRIKQMIHSTTHAQRVDNVRRNWAELRSSWQGSPPRTPRHNSRCGCTTVTGSTSVNRYSPGQN
ncbi:hypothetical protein ACFQ3Z_07760 [Streptomyces nogalater]